MKRIYHILSLVSVCVAWNSLNCPAPRAPDNGLNFIFRNGEIIHFRCHPGYTMYGKSVAYCINNRWTHSAPLCLPIHRGLQNSDLNKTVEWKNRELFNWGVYGDGARRLPLINGIWPPTEQAVLSVGVPSTPGPRVMVKEEIDIAELRNKQLQELKKRRRGKQKKGRNKMLEFKRRPVEEVAFDESCVEIAYGRSLPKIAPAVPHAFVYAYEMKKNYPFNAYMKVKYRCLAGFKFARTRTLFCRNNSWIGEKPRCIRS